jgi:hypothetical protein
MEVPNAFLNSRKIILVLWVVSMLLSCTKNEHIQIDNESQSIVDYAFAEQEFCNMPAIILPHLKNAAGAKGLKLVSVNCAAFVLVSGDTVDFDPLPTYSLSATLIKGSMSDNKERTGEIWLSLSNPYTKSGTLIQINLINYVAGGIQFSCKGMSLTTVGESGNYLAQDLSVRGGECRIAQNLFLYECDHRISIFYSGGTYGNTAYYSLYGTAQGQSRAGHRYTAEVTSDIVKFNNCYCFSRGEVLHQPDGFQGKSLDFGAGDCDDVGQFTIDENKVAFKLK